MRTLAAQPRGLAGMQLTLDAGGGWRRLELAQPGLRNVYNALAAAAAAERLGVGASTIDRGLRWRRRAPFGRGETIAVSGRRLHLLLERFRNLGPVRSTPRVALVKSASDAAR